MMKMRQAVSCLVTTFILCCPPTGAMAVDALPKQVLVFGGNGMIGSATMEKLLVASGVVGAGGEDGGANGSGGRNLVQDQYVLVHRGNWYWDTGFTIRPFVRHIKCDRMNKLENCPELFGYVASQSHIDVVIDFSAYHPQCMTEALDMLAGKVKLYIYISTDSVYEVCDKKHTEFTREEDAVRPSDKERQEELNSNETYGNFKLECEEVLEKYRQEKSGPPFISLRLPDVVGPRDNTYRWWIYQLWMKLVPYLEKKVAVPSALSSTQLSLVYVNDVADLMVQLVHNPSNKAHHEAFNLAMTETPTLLELLIGMKNQLNLTDLEIQEDIKHDTIRLYPSVHLGPVDISKAEKVLNWKPTDWPTVLKETVEFYESAIKQVYIAKQKNDIIQTMQTYFTTKPYNVIRGLRQVYGLSYAERKDEL